MADQPAENGAGPADNAAAAPVVHPPDAVGGGGRVAGAVLRPGVPQPLAQNGTGLPLMYPQMQWVRRPDPTRTLMLESILALLDNKGIFIHSFI